MSQGSSQFTVEKRILLAMRKTLGNIVKDVTPANQNLQSPLKDSTIEDIKMCFGLISAREREIAEEAGIDIKDRPHFIDEPASSNVVSIDTITKMKTK
ncbi:MAG TPA: segregation and condensation protein A [Leucothrix mucor]|uniref:Segregation and condensation protein A n=1 Tax=Leucothrix mucor TaxID=45248 RepID=A0A7V2T4U1_LEUMU|nr:segregation and condensation protein A [Leucothrix mucor]